MLASAPGLRARHAALRFAGARPVANSTSCRAAARFFSGPAPGLAGAPGWRSGRRRRDRQAGQFAKRASFTHSVKEPGPALPGAREMAAACFSRHRRPDRIRVRDGNPSGSTRWAFDSGSTRSATARPRAAGTRPGPQRPGISDTTASIGAPAVRRPLGLRSDALHAVLMSKPWCLRSRVPLRSQSC